MLGRQQLMALLEPHDPPCISIFMPAHRIANPGRAEDAILFKNLLRDAGLRLEEAGMRKADIQTLFQPAYDLLEPQNQYFWQYQSDGLAVFISPGYFRYFQLPVAFTELLVVNERFHVKPLLPFFSHNGRFYILALSLKHVRLFLANKFSIRDATPEGIPTSIEEVMPEYRDAEFQFHTETPHVAGRRPMVVFGHGGAADKVNKKADILKFFQRLDKALDDVLRHDLSPVLLMGVDYLLPIYREANTRLELLEDEITGNPDLQKPEELHKAAWPLMERYFARKETQALRDFYDFKAQGLVSEDVSSVVRDALNGKIRMLFVALNDQRWGRVDTLAQTVTLDDKPTMENEDLLDFAAMQTLRTGGEVFTLEKSVIPSEDGVAAVLRY